MKRDIAPTPLDHMIAIVDRCVPADARVQTAIPFLSLMRVSQPTPVSRGVLQPSLCLILQGHKRVYVGSDVLDYGPGEFLVVTVDVAGAGHIVSATPDQPYLLLNLELDPQELAAIVAEAGVDVAAAAQPVRGAYVGKTDAILQEALYQLVRLLDAPPKEAAFLAVGLKREIIYRLLNGEHGAMLYQNVVLDRQDRHRQGH